MAQEICLYLFCTICVPHLRINSESLAGEGQGSVNILDALDVCHVIFQKCQTLHPPRPPSVSLFPKLFPDVLAFYFFNYFHQNQ